MYVEMFISQLFGCFWTGKGLTQFSSPLEFTKGCAKLLADIYPPLD
jgi:hypothetical protein